MLSFAKGDVIVHPFRHASLVSASAVHAAHGTMHQQLHTCSTKQHRNQSQPAHTCMFIAAQSGALFCALGLGALAGRVLTGVSCMFEKVDDVDETIVCAEKHSCCVCG